MYKIINTNITINVKDMHKAINFYVNGLGFMLVKQYGEYYAQISAPYIIIGLHPSNRKSVSSENISIGFTTEDINDAKNKLIEMGIRFVERVEEGGNFIHFKDPDETALYFIDPQK